MTTGKGKKAPILVTIDRGGRPWAGDIEHEWRVQTGHRPTTAVIEASSYVGEKSTGRVHVNIDYVYDKDPREHNDAEPIERIDWPDFRSLIPGEWDPGLSSPFDPVAAREAEKLGLEVAIMNGAALGEFDQYLRGEPFKGSIIS